MPIQSNTPPVQRGTGGKRVHLAAALVVATLGLRSEFSLATESTGAPAMAPVAAPSSGTYKLDKSHASLVLRASHMGFSTYTTRFSRFDSASFEMDAAPQMCLDIMKGPQMLDTAKYPQIVFKSESVRMTGAKSMEISGTLTLHGTTRPMVLAATYNGGYPGMPNMDPQARIGFSAHGSFKRSDFGITFGVPAPGTTMGVGDLIDFSIEAEFTGPPLAVAPEATH